ncbi:MAG TPA: PKD domain-containing protein [Bacteroidia bacterium]
MKKLLLSIFMVIAAIGAQAQITVNPSNACVPASVNVTSTGNYPGATDYEWHVNGTLMATGPSATLTITQPGFNSISLTVYDANSNQIGGDFAWFTGNGYSGIESPLTANSTCPGDKIGFYLNGFHPGGNVSVTWDFGDGTPVVSGTHTSCEHTYTTLNTYTVTANVTSNCGNQNFTYSVNVVNNAPVGNVYVQAQEDTVCPGDRIEFYHPIGGNNYIMDYGDGTVEYGTRTHTYFVPGSYIVKCTFFNSCGSSATAYDTVRVMNNVGIGSNINYFSISDTTICPTTKISFYPPGGFASYSWNFGDGNSSTVSTPTNTYSSVGDYNVTLTLTNGCGYSKSITKAVHVINGIMVDPFSVSAPDSTCPNTSALVTIPYPLNSHENGQPVYFNWNDGTTSVAEKQEQIIHTYSSSGTYNVTATIVNGCGQSYTDSLVIVVDAAATLDPNSFMAGSPLSHSCVGDSVFFIVSPPDIGTFLFDYGDGNTSNLPTNYITGPNGIVYAVFKHAYNANGSYNANVTITSACGSTLTQPAGSVTVSANNALDEESGFFFDESKYYCLNEPVTFAAYGASTYEWDFGDGSGTLITNYSLIPVLHAYTAPGQYTVKMKLRNGCGVEDTMSQKITIPDSHININTSTVSSHCNQKDGKAIAIVNGANPPFAYNWTNADHSFIADSLNAGIYYVEVKDAKGCSTFAVATVSDQQAPTISLNNAIAANCHGEASGAIDITLIGSSAPYTYVWSNGKTSEDINQLVAGPYEVVVTDANGCKATKSVTVGEPNDFTISYVSYPSVCNMSTGVIQTSVQGNTGPYNYLWSNGFTGASLSGLSVGIYSLTVVDSKGCLKEKITSVNEQTAPIVVLDSVSVLNCAQLGGGANVYASTYLGSSPYTYNWNNGASTQDLTGVQPGFYSLLVRGANGCKSILTVDINEQTPEGLSICAVTVDSVTQTNRVIWEMYSRTDIESFNIYRESSQAGLYYLVGNVDADSLHEFIDPSADPSVRGWRYKLSTVSFCGEESAQSDLHKTIHLTLNQGLGSTVNLIWDNYEGLSFNEFYIWRYTTATGWEKIDSIPSNLFSYTDLNAPNPGTTPDLFYYVEGGPLTLCDPTRGAINTSRSNIKSPSSVNFIALTNSTYNTSAIVYPNPAQDMVNLRFGEILKENTVIEMYNSLGQLSLNMSAAEGSNETAINTSGLSNGVYILKVKQSNAQSVQRIIISK